MNRSTSYLLILLGIPFGYVGSYFMQPGIIRTFDSLGDYLLHATRVLSVPSGFDNAARSLFLTGWAGIAIGVLGMGILATILGGKNSTKTPSTEEKKTIDSKSQSLDHELRTFAKLKEDGVITQEDFEKKKREILGS